MKIQPTTVNGVMLIVPNSIVDERGLFARTFDAEIFERSGLPTFWPQSNTSWNPKRGTLRGMHFQAMPHPDPKLIRCTRGKIFDVAVDLRPHSITFRCWTGVELSQDRRDALYVPPGCAHGFLTLEDDCELLYMMGVAYVPNLARGVRWNDSAFDIEWPFDPIVISERDASYPSFTI